MNIRPSSDQIKQPDRPKLADIMGPGLITGASDDDPSGIATYSQAGAQFGYSLAWTLLLTYPLMCAIQMISAQVGRVTGKGLAGNMRRHYPALLVYPLIGLLLVANIINIGADLGAMAAALRLLIDGPQLLFVAAFAAITILLEVFMRYSRYASVLRWLTISLLAYVATVFAVHVPWLTVAQNLVVPHIKLSGDYLAIVVAVFGTTISPYLFFWQAAEEVEDEKEDPDAKPLIKAPQQAPRQLARIQLAQFGYSLAWTLLLTYPLMCAIQMISAQVGRVTGKGLAGNMRRHYPALLVYPLIGLLLVANIINIGADLGAMAAALRLLVDGPQLLFVAAFAAITILLEVFMRYSRYASVLRWLTISLLAYVATVFAVHVPWLTVAQNLVVPHIKLSGDYLAIVVAVFGTTISPYLFFWQAAEEVEDEKEDPDAKPLIKAPQQAPRQLARIQLDTLVGMGISNVIALFIMITTAATLNAHGVTDIQTSSQAAEALRPIAGRFAFTVFALGIVGTGMLALPVLAGSAAYALGESLHWRVGLAQRPGRAPAFYVTIAAATLVGAALNFTSLDPVKALIWSAIINGVAAVPIMAMIMLMASRKAVMGEFALTRWLTVLGWLATATMAAAALGMFATWGS